MKKHHILLLTGLLIMASLSGCCWVFDCHTHKYRGQFTICQQLLNEYGMNLNQLRGLKVQLNQELLIKKLFTTKTGTTSSNFQSLVLEDNETYEFIRFKTTYIGTIIDIRYPEFAFTDRILQWLNEQRGQPRRQVIVVSFEEGGQLSFISTDSGGFEVQTSRKGKFIKYNNKNYECVYGGAGNSLVVDGDYFYDFYLQFQDPDGEIFKSYHP